MKSDPHRQLMVRRFIQFCLVGASGVLVDMALLFLLADPRTLHWDLSFSKFIAAAIAMANNFLWNELWTFGDLAAGHKWRAVLTRFTTFNLICTIGIVLNVLLLTFQVRVMGFNIYAANLVAIVLVSVWNFGMNLRFSWTRPRTPSIGLARK